LKILVTGTSGFIGFHLTKELLAQGHHVTGVDNHDPYYDISLKLKRLSNLKSKNFRFVHKSIENDLSQLNGNYDIAINLAAQAGVRVSKDREKKYEETNIYGFQNLCKFCENNSIEKILYASSSSVYDGSKIKEFFESSSRLNPKSLYGKSKLLNEKYASLFSEKTGFSLIGLRFFSVYGPYGRPDMAYYKFTDSILKNRIIELNNNGEMLRDMTYIDDIVSGIIGAIKYVMNKNEKCNEIFNLGNSKPIKTHDLLVTIEKILNKKGTVVKKRTINEAFCTHANIEKAKKELGYDPKISFEKGIINFLDWYESYEKQKKS